MFQSIYSKPLLSIILSIAIAVVVWGYLRTKVQRRRWTIANLVLSCVVARGLESLPGVRVLRDGDFRNQTGVVSFVTEGRDCEAVGEALARRGIALRAGLHCAPLAHRTAGTLDTGTLRLSASFFNTPDQADRLVWAVSRVLRENVEL